MTRCSTSRASNAIRRGAADYDIGALALLGVVYARLNQPKNAEQVLAMIIPAAENSTGLSHMHHAQLHIGATLSLLGRKDDAVRWLTKAVDEGYPSFPRFSTDQSLMSLKGYPPYEALLRRLRTALGTLEKKPVSMRRARRRSARRVSESRARRGDGADQPRAAGLSTAVPNSRASVLVRHDGRRENTASAPAILR